MIDLSFLDVALVITFVLEHHFFFSNLLHFPLAVCFNFLLLVGLVLSHLVSFSTCLCLL